MLLLFKKTISYLIDYMIVMFFVTIYTFCAQVFYLDPATHYQAIMMLVCALITILILTTYLPTKTNGKTLGQKIMKLQVINKNGTNRTYLQNFLRECVVKISFAPIFMIFSILYFLVFVIFVERSFDFELPHDFIFKTQVINQ